MSAERHSRYTTSPPPQSHASAGPALTQPPQLIPFSRKLPTIRRNPHLYSLDKLATTQRRAVLTLVSESRHQRQRARRRTLVLTLLLILLVVALIASIVFGLGQLAAFSLWGPI